MKGLTVGDVGMTKVEASGRVCGASGVAMRNQHGVTVELVSIRQGVKVAAGAAGVDMRIRE